MKITVPDKRRLPDAARQFLAESAGSTLFAFYGRMGSGKTTFIRALCHVLGATGEVTSPTFTLVNEYTLPDGTPVYHIDMYRVKSLAEALDFGIEEYLDSGSPCFIEWPGLLEPLLPPEALRIAIIVAGDGSRVIETIPAPPGELLP